MAASSDPSNFYSAQYHDILSVGHSKPTAEIGAPCLIWHVAVWPIREHDPHDVGSARTPADIDIDTLGELGANPSTLRNYNENYREHNTRRWHMLISDGQGAQDKALNKLLERLQKKGRVGGHQGHLREKFELIGDEENRDGRDEATAVLSFPKIESFGFTLWWKDRFEDGTGRGSPNQSGISGEPGPEPLRVRVQVEGNSDYFSLTFLIDAGKLWNSGVIYGSDNAPGKRRRKIFETAEGIRQICEARLHGAVDWPLVPLEAVVHDIANAEDVQQEAAKYTVSPEDAEFLLRGARYFYRDLWEEFCEDFEFATPDIAGARGKIFTNFRGLVLSTRDRSDSHPTQEDAGTPEDEAARRRREEDFARSTATPGRALDKFTAPEANAHIKAYWPFIRRSKSYADYRDYIACGVFGFRGLYVTTLGGLNQFDEGDESRSRRYDDPAGFLPEDEGELQWLTQAQDSQIGPTGVEEPVRYLLLTKFEPHRRQLGRLVDRINTLGTLRLFALKNLELIKEASAHIRMRGQQLDKITRAWLKARNDIENAKHYGQDDKSKKRYALYSYVEILLIDLSSELDKIGENAVGGLSYRISRAMLYVRQFKTMREGLQDDNIDSWVSYAQFAARGLEPRFEFIEAVGRRMSALRNRVATVMESIQTAAIVSQTEGTRENTRELTKLHRSASNLGVLGTFAIFLASFEPLEKVAQLVSSRCQQRIQDSDMLCAFHWRWTGASSEQIFQSYVILAAILTAAASALIILRKDGPIGIVRALWVTGLLSIGVLYVAGQVLSDNTKVKDLVAAWTPFLILATAVLLMIWLVGKLKSGEAAVWWYGALRKMQGKSSAGGSRNSAPL